MSKIITAAALLAMLAPAAANAQAEVPTATPSAPETQMGDTTETGATEFQQEANDDTNDRVLEGAAKLQTEQAEANQNGVETAPMEAPESVEAEDGRIISMQTAQAPVTEVAPPPTEAPETVEAEDGRIIRMQTEGQPAGN